MRAGGGSGGVLGGGGGHRICLQFLGDSYGEGPGHVSMVRLGLLSLQLWGCCLCAPHHPIP